MPDLGLKCSCGHYQFAHVDDHGQCVAILHRHSGFIDSTCECPTFAVDVSGKSKSDARSKKAQKTGEFPGYHLEHIKRGRLGELSKVEEELHEALDAERQGCKLMVLLELSDLIGAVEAYLEARAPEVTLDDLKRMSDITKRAFRNGHRG